MLSRVAIDDKTNDGVYLTGTKPPVFRRIVPPSSTDLQALMHRIAEGVGRALERRGLLSRDCETSYLTLDPADDSAMSDLLGTRSRIGWQWTKRAIVAGTVPNLCRAPRPRCRRRCGRSGATVLRWRATESSRPRPDPLRWCPRRNVMATPPASFATRCSSFSRSSSDEVSSILCAQLLHSAFDRLFLAGAVDAGGVVLGDSDFPCGAHVLERRSVEAQAHLFGDQRGARENSDSSSMAVRASPKPSALTAATFSIPRSSLRT